MNEEEQEEFEKKWRAHAKKVGADKILRGEKNHLQIQHDLEDKDKSHIRKSKIVEETKNKKVSKKKDASSESSSSRSSSGEKRERKKAKDQKYSRTNTNASNNSNPYNLSHHQQGPIPSYHHQAPLHFGKGYHGLYSDFPHFGQDHSLHHDPSFAHLPPRDIYSSAQGYSPHNIHHPAHLGHHFSPPHPHPAQTQQHPAQHFSPPHHHPNQQPAHHFSPHQPHPAQPQQHPAQHFSPHHPQQHPAFSPYHPHPDSHHSSPYRSPPQTFSPTHPHQSPGRAPPASRQPHFFSHPVDMDNSPLGASYPPPPQSASGHDTPSIRPSRY